MFIGQCSTEAATLPKVLTHLNKAIGYHLIPSLHQVSLSPLSLSGRLFFQGACQQLWSTQCHCPMVESPSGVSQLDPRCDCTTLLLQQQTLHPATKSCTCMGSYREAVHRERQQGFQWWRPVSQHLEPSRLKQALESRQKSVSANHLRPHQSATFASQQQQRTEGFEHFCNLV